MKPEKDGTKILRITQFSSKGSLFMSAWDPVGLDGFSDMYSLNIVNACTEQAAMRTPDGAVDAPLRMSWKDVSTKVSFGKNDKGEPKVPDALATLGYDAANLLIAAIEKAGVDLRLTAWNLDRDEADARLTSSRSRAACSKEVTGPAWVKWPTTRRIAWAERPSG